MPMNELGNWLIAQSWKILESWLLKVWMSWKLAYTQTVFSC